MLEIELWRYTNETVNADEKTRKHAPLGHSLLSL